MKMIVQKNRAKCTKCDTIVVSEVEDVFKSCSCGSLRVAGGQKDMIRQKNDGLPAVLGEDYYELSMFLLTEEAPTPKQSP